MNRYDPEIQQILAERGSMRGRLVRGVPWAIFFAFLGSILAFSFILLNPAYRNSLF